MRATRGVSCAPPQLRALTPAEQRLEGHQRVERGLGTTYDRDPDIARRVAIALRAEPKLGNTSIWVEARRQFVTLKGCVRTAEQRAVAETLARRTMGVLRVGNETRVVSGATRPVPEEFE